MVQTIRKIMKPMMAGGGGVQQTLYLRAFWKSAPGI